MVDPDVEWSQRQLPSRTTLCVLAVQPLEVQVDTERAGCLSGVSVPACWAWTAEPRERAAMARDKADMLADWVGNLLMDVLAMDDCFAATKNSYTIHLPREHAQGKRLTAGFAALWCLP